MNENTYDYDVALSFAGEDRKYVEQVAEVLVALSIKVFYDKYETVDLWGKNLYTHLRSVYSEKSKFCIIFISKYYKEKIWTNHERESAQARALSEDVEYILPARFDDTTIAGIPKTISYIDLTDFTPTDFAYMIAKKINPEIEINQLIDYLLNFLGENYKIYLKGIWIVFDCEREDYYGEFSARLLLDMYRLGELENMFLIPAIVPW